MALFHELHALALARSVSRKPVTLRRKTDDGTVIVKPSAQPGGFTADATRTALAKDGATVEFRGELGEWTRADPGIRLAGSDAVEFFDRGGKPEGGENVPAAEGANAPAPENVPAAAAHENGRARAGRS